MQIVKGSGRDDTVAPERQNAFGSRLLKKTSCLAHSVHHHVGRINAVSDPVVPPGRGLNRHTHRPGIRRGRHNHIKQCGTEIVGLKAARGKIRIEQTKGFHGREVSKTSAFLYNLSIIGSAPRRGGG